MSDPIRDNGVVGSGGAGFPTAVKLSANAETFIVNGAECEPLLHKDKELLLHHSAEMLQGLACAMERVGAKRGIIGIKKKYEQVIAALAPQLPRGTEICPLSDTYPAGDEFVLVYEVTGKVIPPGGLPKDVGAVVNNVETLINVGAGKPVTHKYLTVAGAVKDPVTLRVPIGMSFREVIDAAGGAAVDRSEVIVGGVMMGRLATDLEEPVTKTTGGLLVFPGNHPLVERYRQSWTQIERIGRAACDQCSFCTERCPRYLLGHPIQPHQAMRSLGFAPDKDRMILGTLYCCECKLCSLFSCPEGLDPRSVCAQSKPLAREKGLRWSGDPAALAPHPLYRERRVPTKRLMSRLGLTGFHNVGPLDERPLRPRSVTIPLRQHTGAPSVPVVRAGDAVTEGQLLASIPDKALGANLHASITGTVRDVTGSAIVIEA
ncbi:MAG: SLBB domain-containing protein [Deltaproteobacteria bacterium]|nr:SLBB domain-containing protein [Deltaproteobacteria bacterium]